MLNVAVRISLSASGAVENSRIALGCVGPTVFLAKAAEAQLQGKLIDEPTILAAAQCAEEESTPISDLRASGDYRSNIVAVLVRRALTEAAGELLGKGH